jgi:hypothetical protein
VAAMIQETGDLSPLAITLWILFWAFITAR